MTRRWKSTDPYPKGGTFGELLDWHLTVWGTNPSASKDNRDRPWVLRNFAAALRIGLPEGKDENGPEKNLRNWRSGTYHPDPKDDRRIFEVLFGGNPELADWNDDLQKALDSAREAKRKQAASVSSLAVADSRGVPRPTVHFMGRDDEVGALASVLASAEHSAVLIQGGPGIGKTEITKAIAHHPVIANHFGLRRFFVSLENAQSSAAMQDAIIDAIGLEQPQAFSLALERLSQQPSLIILDNLETPWTPIAEQQATENALAEMSAIPNVAILASFRGREAVGGCDWHEHHVEPFATPVAMDLFASLAGARTLDHEDSQKIISALGGIPLAIELVARRAHGRNNLATLWREWERVGSDLAVRPGFAAGRLTSLPHSIELSLRQLQADEGAHPAMRLFSYLGVLPDGLTDWDVRYLIGDDGFAAVEKLCHIGLAFERAERTDLLPPIRDHARLHYPPNENETRIWMRHFVGSLYGYSPPGETAAAEKQRYLSDSFHNLEAAIMAAKDTRHVDGTVIRNFCEVAQMGFKSADSMSALAKQFAQSCNFFGEATCYRYMASFHAERGQLQKAYDLYSTALRLFEDWGDPASRIDCLFGLADIAETRGEYDHAKEFAQAVIPWAIMIEDEEWGDGDRMRGIAQIARNEDRLEDACSFFKLAVENYQKFNDRRSLAICYRSQGACLIKLGRHGEARQSLSAALSHYSIMHNTHGMARCLKEMGDLHRIERADIAAENCYREARNLFNNIRNEVGVKDCDTALADVTGGKT